MHLPNGVNQTDLRDTIKAAFNAMLNSPKPLRQAPAGIKPSYFGLKWADLSNAISTFHEPIAHHFYTGVGLKLQRLDSDIAERILVHFAKQGVAILPLHDSFLMHEGYESWLEPVMSSVFKEVIGTPTIIDSKKARKSFKTSDNSSDETATDNLEELLAELDVGYENRLKTFRDLVA